MKRWFVKLLKNRRKMLGLIAMFCGGFFLIPYLFAYLAQFSSVFEINTPLIPKADTELVNLRTRWGKTAPIDPRLVFLSVDPQTIVSINTLLNDDELKGSPALQAMNSSWPWPRSVYGYILDKLVSAGARVVIFDFLYPQPGPGDPIFKKAVEKYHDNVVLKSNFSDFATGDGTERVVLGYPTDSIIGETNPDDSRLAYANFWPDPDGYVRRAAYRMTLSNANRLRSAPGETVYYSTAARVAKNLLDESNIPGQPGEQKLFRYAGAPDKSFPTRPIYEIFIPKFWKDPAMYDNGNYFKDKIVMVGPYGNYFKDYLLTPYGSMNGAEIHLQALNAILTNSFLNETSFLQEVFLIIAAAFSAWLCIFMIPSPARRVFAGIFLSAAFLFVLQMLYNFYNFQVNSTAAPLLAFNCINLFGLTYEFILEQIEKARVRSTFERYVSRNVVREILDKREDFENLLGGKRKDVTILFSDIRGFTTMTESSDSSALVERLNEYLSAMVRCVYKTDGTLDKFIGDAVMAVWGNVVSTGVVQDGEHAIDTALDMLRELRRLNEKWVADGLIKWEIGIGLNHGEVIVGNMGASEKMEFTVIGDAVNLASRLESLTKEYGLELIIGESLATLIKDKYHLQSVDLVAVKGKTKPVEVFAVLGKLPDSLTEKLAVYHQAFEEGVRFFRARQFSEAQEKFSGCAAAKPGDYLATKVYPERCAYYLANPPAADWDGVHRMKSK